MPGLSKKQPVAEHEARNEIERVYHEIRQTLRVTGVNLNFRTWAAFGDFLPLVWDAMRANAETRAFESAADQLRADAARAAAKLGPLEARSRVSLGESQSFQIHAALDLYYYVTPKLLVFTSAISLLLQEEEIGRANAQESDRLAPGAPGKMYAMEMEAEDPDDERLNELYRDIKETLSLPSVNSYFRALALWPDYLSAAWQRLKLRVQMSEYREAVDQLRESSRALARELPQRLSLDRQAVNDAGADIEEVIETSDLFEQLIPGAILNIALLQLDWRQGAELAVSPFPAASLPFEKVGAR